MGQVSRTFLLPPPPPPPKGGHLQYTNIKEVVVEEESSELKFSEILPNFKMSLKHQTTIEKQKDLWHPVTSAFPYGIFKQIWKDWMILSLFETGNEKLAVMQFKQKNSFRNYRPFQNWLNLKKNVYLFITSELKETELNGCLYWTKNSSLFKWYKIVLIFMALN